MKRGMIPYIILVLLSSLIFLSESYAKEITYKRIKATNYASEHCGSADPYSETNGYNFKDYKCWNGTLKGCENYKDSNGDGIGDGSKTDCANFMSQSLINGGLNFECVKKTDVIGTGNKNKGEKGVVGANRLIDVLQNNFCFENVSTSEAKEGDIAAWRKEGINWVHHVVILNEDGYFAGHTNDREYL